MPRRLVTLRRVSATHPIPNADRIVAASVDGWTCVIQKDELAPGDLAVFFEIDSFLPATDPRWEHLAARFTTLDGAQGFRVRSLKMRGQISQGLLIPLARFPEVEAAIAAVEAGAEAGEWLGEDGRMPHEEAVEKVMRDHAFEAALGVRKWDAPETTGGNSNSGGPFPHFIARTDQERVQNLPWVFTAHADVIFQETTKLDGSSWTAYFLRDDSPYSTLLPPLPPPPSDAPQHAAPPGGRFGVCSRNIELPPRADNHFWAAALARSLPTQLAARGRSVAVQGELVGSAVQGNAEGFAPGFHDVYVFGAWDIERQCQMPPREVEVLAGELGLRHVPVHGYRRLREVGGGVADFLARAEGVGVNGRKREGIVLKAEDGGLSFKAISNSYLLKRGQ